MSPTSTALFAGSVSVAARHTLPPAYEPPRLADSQFGTHGPLLGRTRAVGQGGQRPQAHWLIWMLLLGWLGIGASHAQNGPVCGTYANRTTANGLGDNNQQAVYVVGSTVYAASFGGGLGISTDGGQTFSTKTTANGLGDDRVRSVYAVGNTIYVGTIGGLSISNNGGQSFVTKTTANGLGTSSVLDVYVVGSTVYAGTQNGLSISTDGGNTFTNYTNGLGGPFVRGVYVVGSTIYAATAGYYGTDYGVSISTNGGQTFTNYTTGLVANVVYKVYAVGSTVYAATNKGLGISTDGGRNFINKTTANGLGSDVVLNVYAVGTTVYAATYNGLSISTNGGQSFTNYTTGNGLGNNTVSGVYATADKVYAATLGGLSFCPPPPTLTASTATGSALACVGTASANQQFTLSGNYLTGNVTLTAPAGFELSTSAGSGFGPSLTLTPAGGTLASTIIYVRTPATATTGSKAGNVTISSAGATDQTVAVSATVNAIPLVGITASPAGTVLPSTAVQLTATGASSYVWEDNSTANPRTVSPGQTATYTVRGTSSGCSAQATTTVTVSADPLQNGPSCDTYTTRSTGSVSSNKFVYGVYAVGSTVYAATGSGLGISTDGGQTFTNKTTANGLGSDAVLGVYAVGNTVYAATLNGLSISTDGGQTFTNKTAANGLGRTRVEAVYAVGNTVYAATQSGLSISTDGGNTFANKTTVNGLGSDYVYGVYAVGSTVYAATVGGLSISTDGGNTFVNKATANGLSNTNLRWVYVIGSTVYAATEGGLYISSDGGQTFTAKTTANGLGNNSTFGVYALGSTVYVATLGGLSISTDGGNTFVNYTTANGLVSNFGRGVYAAGSMIYAATVSGLSLCAPPPTLTASTATGTALACVGTASANQQFTLSGSNLTASVTLTAPAGFELSTSAGSGFGPSLTLTPAGGTVPSTTIYVRTPATATTGSKAGNVTISSAGATDQTVAVSATVNAIPLVGITASPAGTVLPSTAVQLTATGASSYVWEDNSTANPRTVSPGQTAIYTVRGTSSGCSAQATTTVTVSADLLPNGPSCDTYTTRGTGSGLGSSQTQGVYAVGSTVYVATLDGLSISTNGGQTFVNKTTANGLGSNAVYGVHTVGATVYAATAGGLSISTDGGLTFSNKTTANGLVHNFVVGVYGVGSTVYAATLGGLSISTDGGQTFANKTTANGLGGGSVNEVYAVGSTVYVATDGGMSISTDGGQTFVTRGGLNYVTGVYVAGSTIYAATISGVRISTDGGQTYATYTSGLGNLTVYKIYVVGSTVYAATDRGLSISTNGGNTFTNYNTDNGLGSSMVAGVYATASTVYAATLGGLSFCPPPPTFNIGTVTGTAQACVGTASASQQFTLSGSNLTASVTLTAPAGFELSTSAGSGFGPSLTLTPAGGTVPSTTIYVRTPATATTGSKAGNVTISSAGATDQTVAVSATVNAIPLVGITASPAGTVLPSTAVQLTATGASSYVWEDNSTANPRTVSPGQTAIYTVRGTSSGCSAQATATVVVNQPGLSVGAVTGTALACLGTASSNQQFTLSGSNLTATVTLTAPAGFELSTNAGSGFENTLTLTPAGGAVTTTVYVRTTASATAGSQSGNVTISSAGTADQTVAVSATVNALPPASLGSDAPLSCTKPLATLTASPAGLLSYVFSPGASPIGTGNQATVSTAGPYSVTVTSVDGCTSTAQTTVTADQTVPVVSLSNDGPLSETLPTVTLTASPGRQARYTFSPGTSPINAGNQAIVDAAGTYSVTVTAANGCSATAQTTVEQTSSAFGIRGVQLVSCQVLSGQQRLLSFSPQYGGLDGTPVSFSVVNELLPLTTPGPYTLRLYTDNPTITLVARQSGLTRQYRYNWLAACAAPGSNTPPTVARLVPPQSAPVGQAYSLSLGGVFTDNETPGQLSLSVAGLPAGLVFSPPAVISGVPAVAGLSSVTLVATDPASLTVSTTFELTVRPSGDTPPPAGPFALSGVQLVSCQVLSAGERRVSFTPQYTGLDGTPVSFSVASELLPLTTPGPYTLNLYTDNPTITLVARQSVQVSTYAYNWLAACAAPVGNTPPTVARLVPPQSAPVGQAYSLSLGGVFTDNETPGQLSLSVAGLPAGLVFSPPAVISGVPAVAGLSSVTLVATDPASLTVSTTFELTVRPSGDTPPPAGPFALSGVQLVSCQVLSAGERRVSFTPQYTGLDGTPVSFSVANELSPVTTFGPYTLTLYTDNPTITLVARQSGQVSTYAYNWLAACLAPGGRAGVAEKPALSVLVLGNPVSDGRVRLLITGATGALQVRVIDGRGQLLSQQGIVPDRGGAAVTAGIGTVAGVYLLDVQTATQRQVVKVVRE